MNEMPPLTRDRLLNKKDLCTMLDCSVQTINRMTSRGELPVPTKFSRRMVRWKESDMIRWILERTQNGFTVSKNY